MEPLARLTTIFDADLSALDRGLAQAQRRLMSAQQRLGRMATMGLGGMARGMVSPVTDVFNKAQRVWQNSLSIGGIAMGGGLAYATKQAMDLQSAFTAIDKAGNFDTAGLDKLKKGILGMATDPAMRGVALDDLLSIGLEGARLGIGDEGPEALLSYTRAMGMLSVAIDDLPIDQVSQSIGQMSKIWGQGADHALYLGSAVDALADSTSASAAGIFDVAQRLSPTAKIFGMSEADTLGLSAALLDVGMNAEAAGGALSRALGEIGKDPAAFAGALGMGGSEFNALAPMEKVRAILNGLATTDEGFTMLSDMGIDAVNTRTALLMLSQTWGNVARVTQVAGRELQTGGHVLGSVAKNSATTASGLTLLHNRIQVLGAEFGGHLLPVVDGLSSGLGSMFGSLTGWLESNAGPLRAWGESLGTALAQLGELLTTGEGWGEFGDALMESFGIVMQNAIDLATWGGQRIGDELAKGIMNGLNPLRDLGPAGQAIAGTILGPLAGGMPGMGGGAVAAGMGNQARPMPDLRNPMDPFRAMLNRHPPTAPSAGLGGAIGGFGLAGMGAAFRDAAFGLGGGLVADMGRDFGVEAAKALKAQLPARTLMGVFGGAVAGQGFNMPSKVHQAPGGTLEMLGGFLGGAVANLGTVWAEKQQGSMTGQTFGLPDYAKKLQEGAFKGADDPTKKTAKNTADTVKAINSMKDAVVGALAGGMVARAVGPE